MAPRIRAPSPKNALPKKSPRSERASKPKPRGATAAVAPASAKPKAKPASKSFAQAKAAPAKAAPAARNKKGTQKPGRAREALQAAAMKKAIEEVIAPVENDKAVVDAYMRDLDHPFKAEMEAVRAIILGASRKVSERIKWNALAFHYEAADLAAFNPRASECAHLILMFPGGAGVPAKSALLEGKAKDRREAKFLNLEDLQSKKKALEKLVKDWVKLRDA